MREDLPVRKAGLWEMKLVRVGSALPEMTMQHCTDATTDKDMNNMVSPMAKQICSKQEVQKTATGYISDFVCSSCRRVADVAFGHRRRFRFRLQRDHRLAQRQGPGEPAGFPPPRSKRSGSATASRATSPATS